MNHIVTLYTADNPVYKQIGEISVRNKSKYADTHGYKIFVVDKLIQPNRSASWNKIDVLFAAMKQPNTRGDWFWWTDADSLVMNPQIKLESLVVEEYDVILTQDPGGLNAGQILMRSDRFTWNLLERIWKLGKQSNASHGWKDWEHEQAAIRYELLQEKNWIHTKFLHQRAMNSYIFNYRPGDFVIHFAGHGPGNGPELLLRLMQEWDAKK